MAELIVGVLEGGDKSKCGLGGLLWGGGVAVGLAGVCTEVDAATEPSAPCKQAGQACCNVNGMQQHIIMIAGQVIVFMSGVSGKHLSLDYGGICVCSLNES